MLVRGWMIAKCGRYRTFYWTMISVSSYDKSMPGNNLVEIYMHDRVTSNKARTHVDLSPAKGFDASTGSLLKSASSGHNSTFGRPGG